MPDKSNGYEAIAEHFIRGRNPVIGPSTVCEWTKKLPRRATILELGCGHGMISQVLFDEGFQLYAIDASPTLLAKFRARFPDAPSECCAVEDSEFFGRKFDAIVAWGLIFMLPEETQRSLIRKVAEALSPGGRFLFTAEKTGLEWDDVMTGRRSVSLAPEAYHRELDACGLEVEGHDIDAGENFYYFARKPK